MDGRFSHGTPARGERRDQMPELMMHRFDVHRQAMPAQCLGRGWPDRADHGVLFESSAQLPLAARRRRDRKKMLDLL